MVSCDGVTAPGRVHVVGAGLAGLAAAVALAGDGHRVTLYEAAPQAGGRCRSFFDDELGCRIDNGNHLLLAGNRAALGYLGRIGALDTIEGPREALIPFCDLATGERWELRPNEGGWPWWTLSGARRVPGTHAWDYLGALKLRGARPEQTVAEVLDPAAPLFRRLWQPFAVAALNTGVEAASARLFWQVLAETLGQGGAACRPLVPREGLSESFVAPALAWLAAKGVDRRFAVRLRNIEVDDERAVRLAFDDGGVPLGPDDDAILAVPAAVAARLVPGLAVPDEYEPIVNAHFRAEPPAGTPLFTGVVGGTAEWIFRKPGILSVTVSAASRLVDRPATALLDLLWRDVASVYGMAGAIPPGRVVKERRATFRASPAQLLHRPGVETRWANLLLAGDYVDTGLPASIEGAIRSGLAAATQLCRRRQPAGPRDVLASQAGAAWGTAAGAKQRALP